SGLRRVSYEACTLHPAPGFRVLHESIPDKTCACVLGHHNCNSRIDTHDVRVIPLFEGIEGIDKSVTAPGAIAVAVLHITQDAQALARKKRQRARGRARHYAAIDRTHRRWSTPRHVAVHGIGSGDAPQVFAIAWKLLR